MTATGNERYRDLAFTGATLALLCASLAGCGPGVAKKRSPRSHLTVEGKRV